MNAESRSADEEDARLVDAANRGDRHALETLYERHRDWVGRTALRLTGHRDDALDVLQETFLYFFRKFPGFEKRARLRTLLYPVVRNLAIDAGRRRRRHTAGARIPELPAREPRPPADERAELEARLASLSDGHREVVLLRFADDFALAEIAAALEIPVGTVKSRLHLALKQLKESGFS
ncbi:MAG: RNA polymerase sigma factor [Planctomycetota bacterium]